MWQHTQGKNQNIYDRTSAFASRFIWFLCYDSIKSTPLLPPLNCVARLCGLLADMRAPTSPWMLWVSAGVIIDPAPRPGKKGRTAAAAEILPSIAAAITRITGACARQMEPSGRRNTSGRGAVDWGGFPLGCGDGLFVAISRILAANASELIPLRASSVGYYSIIGCENNWQHPSNRFCTHMKLLP